MRKKGSRGIPKEIEMEIKEKKRKEKRLKTKTYPKNETCNEWQFQRKEMEQKQQMSIN